jgi:hypothetical protein
LVYEVDTFEVKQHPLVMESEGETNHEWTTSSVVNDAVAVYPAEVSSVLNDIFERFDPVKGVRYLTAAVERQLAKKKQPKSGYAAALMRGLAVREELKLKEGGSYSAEETRTLLGISKTAVLKRYQKGQLIGWREAGQGAVRFPVWQFKDHNVLPGLPEVLEIFASADWLDDWTRVLFFLGARRSLDGRRPLDLLREGQIAKVRSLAEGVLE